MAGLQRRAPLGEVAPYLTAVFGAGGYICRNQRLVSDSGFGELGDACGATS